MSNTPYVTLENSKLKLSELLTQIQTVLSGGVAALKLTSGGTLQIADSLGAYKGQLRYNNQASSLQYSNDGGSTWANLASDSFEWSASATYALGAMCWYQGVWYTCVTASTTDVPGSGSGWAVLTPGKRIRYAGSNAELVKALADRCETIVITGNISGSLTATAGSTPVSIFSHESVSITGAISLTIPAGGNVYWHSYGTPFSGGTITATGGTLWIRRLVTGSVTLTGNIKYQAISGTVTGGTQESWDSVDTSSLLAKDISSLTTETWSDDGLLYVYDNGPRKMELGDLADETASRSVAYLKIDSQGLLSARPTEAAAGYHYYATDNGNVYTMLRSGSWDSGTHIQGPQGKIAVPSLTNAGVLSWTLSSEASPSLPSSMTIKGADGEDGDDGVNGWTFTPAINAYGVLSWTASQITSTPSVPAAKNITGPVGFTFVPNVDSSTGNISWTKTQSEELPTPETVCIKGPTGATGATGPQGPTGAAGASPVVTFTEESGYTIMTVTVGATVTSTNIPDGARGETGPAGVNGANAYVFVRYAEDTSGTGFTDTPGSTKKYIGVISKTVNTAPVASEYTGKWSKYLGDNGTLSEDDPEALGTADPGESSDAARADHVHPTTGLVTTPTGTGQTGQVIAKSDTGYTWASQPTWATLSGRPVLATVATTGSYDDLEDTPTIPTVNNPTITFTQGGDPKGSFSLNQSTAATIALDAGGTASIVWGDIDGTLSDQEDLQDALDAKADASTLTTHTGNAAIHVPASGTTGYVLTKTENGTEWAAGGAGSGDMLKSTYDTDDDGVVDAAEEAVKLSTARNIGSASFDGTADISLSDIIGSSGIPKTSLASSVQTSLELADTALQAHQDISGKQAKITASGILKGDGDGGVTAATAGTDYQAALPSGTSGYYLQSTGGTGVQWAAVSTTAAFASITGQPTDNANLATALGEKITNPSGGSTGQYLQKTENGVTWATGSSATDYKTVRLIESTSDLDSIEEYCRDNLKTAIATPATDSWWSTESFAQWQFGHLYMAMPIDFSGFYQKPFPSTWNHSSWRYYYKFTGGTCVYNGTTYTLTPYSNGDSEGWSSTDSEFYALYNKCLKISDTQRIKVWVNADYTAFVAFYEEYISASESWSTAGTCSSFSYTCRKTKTASYGYYTSTPTVQEELIAVFFGDITAGVLPVAPTTLSTTAATVKAGMQYSWTLSANSTISADSVASGKWATCEIDISPGAYDLTAGTNMTIVGTLTASKLNHCVVKWRGPAARLRVVDVED